MKPSGLMVRFAEGRRSSILGTIDLKLPNRFDYDNLSLTKRSKRSKLTRLYKLYQKIEKRSTK